MGLFQNTFLKIMSVNVHENMCTRMFIAELPIVLLNWKQPKPPSVAEWVNNL